MRKSAIGERGTNDVDTKFLGRRLFEIRITATINLLSDIVDGLTAKWGETVSVINDTLRCHYRSGRDYLICENGCA